MLHLLSNVSLFFCDMILKQRKDTIEWFLTETKEIELRGGRLYNGRKMPLNENSRRMKL